MNRLIGRFLFPFGLVVYVWWIARCFSWFFTKFQVDPWLWAPAVIATYIVCGLAFLSGVLVLYVLFTDLRLFASYAKEVGLGLAGTVGGAVAVFLTGVIIAVVTVYLLAMLAILGEQAREGKALPLLPQ